MKPLYSILFFIAILAGPSVYGFDRCQSVFSELGSKSLKFDTARLSESRGLPDAVKERFPRLAESQPRVATVMGSQFRVHNSQVSAFMDKFKDNPEWHWLSHLVSLLHDQQTFHFPLTAEGFVPAANNGEHHGGYGSFVWLRDLARVASGVSALPKLLSLFRKSDPAATAAIPQLQSAMLRLFSEDKQIVRTLQNILDPQFHLDPQNGFRNVVFVRLGLSGRSGGRSPNPHEIETESKWGHKQNDALALYAHSILDAIAKGEISPQTMSIEAKAELIYLVSYFQRIGYASMADVGAWEERMGVRTSSMGLVTSFLERFNEGWQTGGASTSKLETQFFSGLRDDWKQGRIREHLEGFINSHGEDFKNQSVSARQQAWVTLNTSLEQVNADIIKSYRVLLPRLGIYRTSGGTQYRGLTEVAGSSEARGADAALLHLLLYPPRALTVKDRLHIIDQLKSKLMRESGFVRYSQDWFLYGNPNAVESAGKLPIDPGLIAVTDGNGFRNSTRADRDQVYQDFVAQKYEKNMSSVIEKNGSDLEAQWSFQDSMLVQIYVKIYKETGDATHLKSAWFHLARSLAWITDSHELSIEGAQVTGYRAPEAWIPVRMKMGDQVFTSFFASPNSPLNWTTAELVTALQMYLEVTKK